jgi:signal transduction histidine kinase
MTRAARSWLVLVLCAVAVAGALGWMTALGLELERGESVARTSARQEEAARVALWRMDSAFSNELLRASTRLLRAEGGPSPLFHCGFHVAGARRQVLLAAPTPELSGFVHALSAEALLAELARAESTAPFGAGPAADAGQFPMNANVGEYQRRTDQVQQMQGASQQAMPAALAPTGALVAVWTGSGEGNLLFVQRDAAAGGGALGLWADWPAVREFLLAQVRDLLPGAELRRARASVAPDEWRLASVPVVLSAPRPEPAADAAWSPIRIALLVAWSAVLLALVAGALVLRAAQVLGERRGRFVSAVTHELRTPLTTFRLYAQMLASGMVREEGQRQEYLDTLQTESERLVRVVDGVLQFSRLEGRGAPPQLQSVAVAEVLAQVMPRLSQRAAEAGMTLAVEDGAGAMAIRTDPHSLEQILFNLVDNACKYAAAAGDRRLHLRVLARGRHVAFEVADHGPGVPAAEAARIFEPFRRGSAPEIVSSAGVGLGLALAREMARGLGGDLVLESVQEGARFIVTVPVGEA